MLIAGHLGCTEGIALPFLHNEAPRNHRSFRSRLHTLAPWAGLSWAGLILAGLPRASAASGKPAGQLCSWRPAGSWLERQGGGEGRRDSAGQPGLLSGLPWGIEAGGSQALSKVLCPVCSYPADDGKSRSQLDARDRERLLLWEELPVGSAGLGHETGERPWPAVQSATPTRPA